MAQVAAVIGMILLICVVVLLVGMALGALLADPLSGISVDRKTDKVQRRF
jgi:hypothetical protein